MKRSISLSRQRRGHGAALNAVVWKRIVSSPKLDCGYGRLRKYRGEELKGTVDCLIGIHGIVINGMPIDNLDLDDLKMIKLLEAVSPC